MELNGWNGKQLAEAINITPTTVSRSLALLRLPEEIQLKIESVKITSRSAYELTELAAKKQIPMSM